MKTTIEVATRAIIRAARNNPHIKPDHLREEVQAGDIEGWLEIPEVNGLTIGEWSSAMLQAADVLSVQAK